MLLVDRVGQGPSAEAGIQLGLHESPEIFLRTASPHHPDFLVQYPPGIVGRDPVAEDAIEILSQGPLGHALFPRLVCRDRQLRGGEYFI
jgi:hypothetical protein